MSTEYVQKPGECCSSIAHKLGLRDYHDIFDMAENATLRTYRPNPNQLKEGDQLQVPDQPPKDAPLSIDVLNVFKIFRRQVRLRIVLIDWQDAPIAGMRYELLIGENKRTGKTGNDGLIEVPIDPEAMAGKLTVGLDTPAEPVAAPAAPAAPAPAAPAPADPPPYPPPIQAADFTDKEAAEAAKESQTITWELALGALPSFNSLEGAMERLSNLGFPYTDANGDYIPSPITVRAYQLKYGMPESGNYAHIQNNLRDRHDSP